MSAPVPRTAGLALLAFVLGFGLVFSVAAFGRFLVVAYHHGGL